MVKESDAMNLSGSKEISNDKIDKNSIDKSGI